MLKFLSKWVIPFVLFSITMATFEVENFFVTFLCSFPFVIGGDLLYSSLERNGLA
jgi:hypothetical protein